MGLRGAVAPTAAALLFFAGIARSNSVSIDLHFNSGAIGGVTFDADAGGLNANFTTSMDLSSGGTAQYNVQLQMGDLTAPGGLSLSQGSVFQNVVFQSGPLHIWPTLVAGSSPAGLFGNFQQFLADSHIGLAQEPAQILFATLTPTVLNGVSPVAGVAFLRPAGALGAPFNYLPSFELGSNGYEATGSVPTDLGELFANDFSAEPAPEPATVGLMLLGLGGVAVRLERRRRRG